MIRSAKASDQDEIETAVRTLVATMLAQGNDQWGPEYPLRSDFARDLEKQALFVDDQDGQIRGWVALDSEEPSQYASLPWSVKSPVLVVHRLGVCPDFQRRGVAEGLLAFAERLAHGRALRGLRADTAESNAAMNHLFEKRHWRAVGKVNFPDATIGFLTWEKASALVWEWEGLLAGGSGDGSGAFVSFPWDAKACFGKANMVPIYADFEGLPYRGILANMGSGPCLVVLKEIREKLGKVSGDRIRVRVWADTDPRIVEAPLDLSRALEANPEARLSWEGFSNSHKKEYVRWIEEAKKAETRASRVVKALVMIAQKKKLK